MERLLMMFLFVAVVLTAPGIALAQDTYYVQSLRAKIMSAPSFKAKVVGEASKGTKLSSSGREGSWIKVRFYEREGYVAALILSKYPPLNRQSVIKGEETEIKQSVRRRASTYTSAAAARGLAQDDRRRLSRDEKADYTGLEKMESVTVSMDEVMRFMEGSTI